MTNSIDALSTIGSLDLNKTNPAHMGTESKNIGSSSVNSSFGSYILDAVNEMNNQQIDVSHIQEKIITDPDSVDIHDVTTAMAKAQMSLSLAQTVIDRLISGWNEISTTR